MFERISRFLSIIVPKKVLDEGIKPALIYSGTREDPKKWVGLRIFTAILMGLIGFLIPTSLIPLINFLFGTQIIFEGILAPIITLTLSIGFFLITLTLFYLHVSYVIDGRKKMVESILPDFLYLVGNNLKSGMSPFYAFRSAVRPEFGPLSEEIKIATQKSLGVESFSDALKDIGERIDSKVLNDTTKFFAQALRSGGHLAQLIETTASDIKQTNRLKKELITSTRMYTLFILFVVVIASPMLLAVSVQFLNILGSISTQTSSFGGGADTSAGGMQFAAAAISITPEFMTTVSYGIIILNSFLASVFIGLLGGGRLRDGLKYAPIMAIAGIILLIIFSAGVGGLLGGFTG
jgi:archaeal flagellar protein FlaJ